MQASIVLYCVCRASRDASCAKTSEDEYPTTISTSPTVRDRPCHWVILYVLSKIHGHPQKQVDDMESYCATSATWVAASMNWICQLHWFNSKMTSKRICYRLALLARLALNAQEAKRMLCLANSRGRIVLFLSYHRKKCVCCPCAQLHHALSERRHHCKFLT